MKITFIIEHFDAARGGAERFTVWLAGELAKLGHEIHIACHDSNDANTPQNIHIHKLKGTPLNTGIGFRLFGRRASHFLQQHPSDITHSMTVACIGDIYQPHAGVYAEIQQQAIASRHSAAAKLFKRLTLQLSDKQRALLAMERKAIRGPHRILNLCPMLTNHFHKHYGIAPNSQKFSELPAPLTRPLGDVGCHGSGTTSVPDPCFCAGGRHGITPNERLAVFVGHDFHRKGLRYAIEAVTRAKNWKLLVVGSGKTRKYDKNQPQILFIGPTHDMNKVYAAADALLLPTFYDPFALAVLEALSHGLPVISTEFLGSAYLVKDYQAGTIVSSPRDVNQMTEALDALPAPETPEHETLAKNARAASARMPPEMYIEKLICLYEQIQHEKSKAVKS